MKIQTFYLFSATVLGQCDKYFAISKERHLDALSKCSEVKASVNILLDTQTIVLSHLKKVTGDLIISARNATEIKLGSLTKVSGSFKIKDSLLLESLDLGKLTSAGEFSLINSGDGLPVEFKSGLTSANRVVISHTRIKSLKGLNLSRVELLNISGNTELDSVAIPTLQAVHGPLTFEANPSATLDLANLTSVKGKLAIIGSKGANIPKLNTLGGALSIDNTQLKDIHFDHLTSIGEWLSIVQNDALKNVSFPILTKITSSLNIQKNDQLTEIHLPSLKSTDGFAILEKSVEVIDLHKDFSSPGAANVVAGIDCDKFSQNRGEAFARISCNSSLDDDSSKNDTSPGKNKNQTNPEKPRSSTSSGAVQVGTQSILFLALTLAMLSL